MTVALSPEFDFSQLREFAQEKLCELGMLEPDQFPLTERQVFKGGQTCGVMYCLHGPRSVKFTAIADLERKHLICYGSDGVRAQQTELPLA